ncbi:helix-turn-helix domain-containing protein [Micromonospora ureilytica]|uniref:helix-turn-helix domain-containing protein n=1 Tax=Micromonospora ureilytica TaxID=709868 RepID=UPI0033D00B53
MRARTVGPSPSERWCAGVPQSDEQAAAEPDGRYFEHHVLLEAADDLVAAKGFAGVTMEEIASSAGVAKQTALRQVRRLIATLRIAAGQPVTVVGQR